MQDPLAKQGDFRLLSILDKKDFALYQQMVDFSIAKNDETIKVKR